MTFDIEKTLSALTLEEKALLCAGKDYWTTNAIERLGIPSWMMTDGPHGVRRAQSGGSLGLSGSAPATCFPTAAGLASSWNPDLLEEVGRALGREAKALGVGVLLGPGVNIKRSPLCGRNFEYFSEDPFLSGELAVRYIQGLQSEGVGASLKHFAANNQETGRMLVDAVVDETSLREIYLPAFEKAVKEADPWTLMCSYNRLNGTYTSQDPWLLTELLREEWGWDGVVVTDWGACDDRVAGLAAGQDLEMPGSGPQAAADIVAAVRNGSLDPALLDKAVRRLLALTKKVLEGRGAGARSVAAATTPAGFDADAHHALARKVARESMVLLRNEGPLLPLAPGKRIAIIGAFARTPRYQGGGSSHINPTRMDDAFEEALRLAPAGTSMHYAAGYQRRPGPADPALVAEACALASASDIAVVFVGVTEEMESEGFDRRDLRLPPAHDALVEALLEVQPNLVVVLSNGAPVEMPWAVRVPAILESYLGGQAWGGAVADLIFGRASPSGKLAETFPRRLEDNPSWRNFPGEGQRVEYREGLFVGYRHYDSARIEPLFSFGHGLSYSSFEYSGLRLSASSLRDTDSLKIELDITNTGSVRAAEIAQLYVGKAEVEGCQKPLRELKAFARAELQPGETKTVVFNLENRAFAHWDRNAGDWIVATGDYELSAGASSRDIRQRATVHVESTATQVRTWDHNASLGELLAEPASAAQMQAILGGLAAAFGAAVPGDSSAGAADSLMLQRMLGELPLRSAVRLSGGAIPRETARTLIDSLNRRA